jgi:cytochrome c-type biogenesis protein CcmH/NrfG
LAPSDEVVEAYQAGLWAYEEDRLDDATRAFQRVIRLDPTHVEAHNYLGSVFYLNGRQDDAIIALRRALELDPDHSESYLNLGLVYKETGRNSQAVQMFSRYLDLAPPDDTTTEYVREMIDQLNG